MTHLPVVAHRDVMYSTLPLTRDGCQLPREHIGNRGFWMREHLRIPLPEPGNGLYAIRLATVAGDPIPLDLNVQPILRHDVLRAIERLEEVRPVWTHSDAPDVFERDL